MHRATRRSEHPAGKGFTLVEMVVVVALIGILALAVVPAVIQIISREQTRSFSRTSESFLNLARVRAIRGGRPVHVIFETALDVHGNERTSLRALIDEDEDGVGDRLINQDLLPGAITLAAPAGLPVIEGFTVLVGTSFDPEAAEIVFNTDGSVETTGAVRYADPRGNYLELAVGPSRAVGRVVVRKWDGTAFWARGDGPHDWKWL